MAQVVSISVNTSLPESTTSVVDVTSEINLVPIGVVVGFILLIIGIVYKLLEETYSY